MGPKIELSGATLTAPTEDNRQPPTNSLVSALGKPHQRGQSFLPDRNTNFEGSLTYHDVFSPSIRPYKRVAAFNWITYAHESTSAVPVLKVRDRNRLSVQEVSGKNDPPDHWPRFWGSISLDFRHDSRLPLPSVAPNAVVTELHPRPGAELTVLKDSADNFYIERLNGPTVVTLRYAMAAPQSYFEQTLPSTPVSGLATRARPDARLAREGKRFASEIGLNENDALDKVLRRLVKYFREFEESTEPATRSTSIYLDLARNKKGVCRHRAYAFTITAQALGIPTRFVHNEVHAFVEVYIGDWLRIDLGGDLDALTLQQNSNTESIPSHSYRETFPESANALSASNASEQPADRATNRPTGIALSTDTIIGGETLWISGASDPDTAWAAWLVPFKKRDNAVRIGTVLCERDGTFREAIDIPTVIAAGEYRIELRPLE